MIDLIIVYISHFYGCKYIGFLKDRQTFILKIAMSTLHLAVFAYTTRKKIRSKHKQLSCF
ncbi:hypothetical protein C3V39_10020 [Prevotella sp. oral taxon 820]|nr:hypothetical protein C3V39_10020 [Prevotella sp. oral taxon 820]